MYKDVGAWSELPGSVLHSVLAHVPTAALLRSAALVSHGWCAASVLVCCQGQRRLQLRKRDGFMEWTHKHAPQLQALYLELPQPLEFEPLAACSVFQPDVPLHGLRSLTLTTRASAIQFGRQWPCMPQLTYLSICRPQLADHGDIMQLSRLSNLRHLGLQELRMPNEGIKALSAALRALPHLTSLDLSGSTLYGRGRYSLGYVPSLTYLKQLRMGITDAEPDTLAALRHLPVFGINLLLVSTIPLEAEGVGAWLNSSGTRSLQDLELRVMEYSYLFNDPLPASITQGLAACTALRRLTCRGLELGSLLACLGSLPGLTCLRLLDCVQQHKPAEQAPAADGQLEHHPTQQQQQSSQPAAPLGVLPRVADLVCSWVPDSSLETLLQPSVLPAVRRLRLRDYGRQLTDTAIAQLIARLPGLQSLALERLQLTLAPLRHLTGLTALSALQLRGHTSVWLRGDVYHSVSSGTGSSSSSGQETGSILAPLQLGNLKVLHVQAELPQAAVAWLRAECAGAGVRCVLGSNTHIAAEVESEFVL